MEVDNEVSGNGNSYTTQFRQYDPRLGRWKSLDPLMSMFPHMSPYVAFDNNPIIYSDPNGGESENPDDRYKRLRDRAIKLQNHKSARKRAKAARIQNRARKLRKSQRYKKWLIRTPIDNSRDVGRIKNGIANPVFTYETESSVTGTDYYHSLGFKAASIGEDGTIVVETIGEHHIIGGSIVPHWTAKAAKKYGTEYGTPIKRDDEGNILGNEGEIIIPVPKGVDIGDALYGPDDKVDRKYENAIEEGRSSAIIRTTVNREIEFINGQKSSKPVKVDVDRKNITTEVEKQN